MLHDEFEILSVSVISADNKGPRRAPTLIFYQKVDFTKIYEIKNKTMIRFLLFSSYESCYQTVTAQSSWG